MEERKIWLKIALPMFIFCCCLLAIICIVVNWFSRKDKVVDNMPGPEYTKYLD